MSDNAFFKPTVLYKEFLILDLIEKDQNITQRQMAEALGVAVSMVNQYLDDYEKKGLIKRKKHSTKTVEYFVTKKGAERRKLLNIWYLKSSHSVYLSAKDNITSFLNQIIDKGFKKILLYGAGEVAEIMLQVMNDDNKLPLQVIAIIDDNPSKKGESLVNLPVILKENIDQYEHEGILVSSYTHHISIKQNLEDINYPKNKILEFFE
jgi:DNA-binding MarR family transcriptional regulator